MNEENNETKENKIARLERAVARQFIKTLDKDPDEDFHLFSFMLKFICVCAVSGIQAMIFGPPNENEACATPLLNHTFTRKWAYAGGVCGNFLFGTESNFRFFGTTFLFLINFCQSMKGEASEIAAYEDDAYFEARSPQAYLSYREEEKYCGFQVFKVVRFIIQFILLYGLTFFSLWPFYFIALNDLHSVWGSLGQNACLLPVHFLGADEWLNTLSDTWLYLRIRYFFDDNTFYRIQTRNLFLEEIQSQLTLHSNDDKMNDDAEKQGIITDLLSGLNDLIKGPSQIMSNSDQALAIRQKNFAILTCLLTLKKRPTTNEDNKSLIPGNSSPYIRISERQIEKLFNTKRNSEKNCTNLMVFLLKQLDRIACYLWRFGVGFSVAGYATYAAVRYYLPDYKDGDPNLNERLAKIAEDSELNRHFIGIVFLSVILLIGLCITPSKKTYQAGKDFLYNFFYRGPYVVRHYFNSDIIPPPKRGSLSIESKLGYWKTMVITISSIAVCLLSGGANAYFNRLTLGPVLEVNFGLKDFLGDFLFAALILYLYCFAWLSAIIANLYFGLPKATRFSFNFFRKLGKNANNPITRTLGTQLSEDQQNEFKLTQNVTALCRDMRCWSPTVIENLSLKAPNKTQTTIAEILVKGGMSESGVRQVFDYKSLGFFGCWARRGRREDLGTVEMGDVPDATP